MSWLTSHAINPRLAAAVGVLGEKGGNIYFPYGRNFMRTRGKDGVTRQPAGEGMRLWWPVGGERNAHSVLLCEGEGDTLAAASVLCDDDGEPRDDLPVPLAGLVPVGLPGASCPSRVVCGELLAAGTREVFICFDADEAGEAATKRIHRELAQYDIEAYPVELPEGTDLADCLARFPVGPFTDSGYLAHLLADAEAAATGRNVRAAA